MGFFDNMFNSVKQYNDAYQKNLQEIQASQPAPEQETTRGVLAKINLVSKTDPNAANEYMGYLRNDMSNPSSPFYNPYITATNQAVANLASYGIDTSNIDDNWFNANSWLKEHYQYTANTNSVKSPGKRASKEEKAAYQFNQIWMAEEQTKKAETEWKALQQELTYWAQQADRNLSDDQIIANIDWSKYKTLQKMDETRLQGTPMELNRAVGYSQDAMYGTLWAARNNGGTGDSWQDMINSYNGTGNVWKPDAALAAKLDKGNIDTYSPYSVGSTVDKERLYFGVSSFDQKWLDENRARYLGSNDETAQKMYASVAEAEQNTQQAETELEKLNKWVEDRINSNMDEATILSRLDTLLASSDYSTLSKMDKSIQTGGDLMKTTRAIDYRKADIIRKIQEGIANRGKSADETIANITSPVKTKDDINEEAEALLKQSQPEEPEPEKEPVATTVEAPEPKATKPEQTQPKPTPDQLRAAYDAAHGEGAYDRDMAAADVPREKTSTELTEEAKNAAVARAVDVLHSHMSAAEQKYFKALPGVQGPRVADALTVAANMANREGPINENAKDPVWVANLALKQAKAADDKYATTAFGSLETRTTFESTQKDANELRAKVRANEEMYGEKLLATEVVPDSIEVPVNKNDINGLAVQYELGDKGYEVDKEELASNPGVIEYCASQYGFDNNGNVNMKPFFDMCDAQIERLNGYAQTVQDAHAKYPDLTEDEIAAMPTREQMDADATRLANMDRYLAEHQEEYDRAVDELHKADNHRALINDLSLRVGGQYVEPKTIDNILGYVQQFTGYEIPADNYDSVITDIDETFKLGGTSMKEIGEYADGLDEQIEDIRYILDNVPLPDYYKQKLGLYSSWLEQRNTLYKAYQVTEDENFDKLVNEGSVKFYSELNTKVGTSNVLGAFVQSADAAGISQMTDTEQNIYFALYAQDPDRAAAYMQALSGSIYTRTQINLEEGMKETANSGFLGRAFCEAFSIATAPLDVLGSIAYMADTAITGEGNKWFRFTGEAGQNAQKAVLSAVRDAYGDGAKGQIISTIYEILNNRGRSAMVAATFGGLFPADTSEVIQSFPIATTAAAEKLQRCIEAGMEPWQAWTLAGTTFLAESLTEGIELGHMKEAFSGGLSLGSYKDFFLGRIPDALSEVLGESTNDIVEKAFDQWVGGAKGEHAKAIQAYMDAGYTPEEAELRAMVDDFTDVLHTAVVSAFSPGMDVVAFTAGQVSTYLDYAKQVQQRRRVGDADTTIRDLRNGDLKRVQAIEEVQKSIENRELRGFYADEQTPAGPNPAKVDAETQEMQQGDYDKAITLLENAQESDQTTKTATVSVALRVAANNADRSAAAAVELADMYGEDTLDTLELLLNGGAAAGTNLDTLKFGIQYAALANGRCRTILESEAFRNADNATQARWLSEAAQDDARNADVQAQVEQAVHEFRVSAVEQDLLAQGQGAQAEAAQAKADAATMTVKKAEDRLADQQEVEAAAADNTEKANADLRENPTPDNLNAVTHAVGEQRKAAEVTEEYEQSAENAREGQKQAQDEAEKVVKETQASIRQQAEAIVAEQDRQMAEQAEQAREQQRIADEEAAKAQAEEDEKSGKAWENRRDTLIEDLLNRDHLEGDEREAKRQEYMQRAEQIKLGNIDMTGLMNNTEGYLAISAFGRKLGLNFELSDTLPGNARGMYANGTVYLNSNLIRNGNMTIGQALVEASLHEITHSMESTKSYQTYRDVVLGSLFNGDQAAYQSAIDQKIADYKEAVGQDLTPEQAEKEIIADFARTKLNGKDVVQRFMDAGLGGKMRNALHNINQAIKNFRLTGEERTEAEYLRKAERAFQRAIDEVARTSVHPEGGQFSVVQFAQAAGMTVNQDTLQLFDANGNEIDGVNNKVTADMINGTPVGMLIDIAQQGAKTAKGVDKFTPTISAETAQAQKQMFADLMNMVAQYKDSNLVWEIASSTMFSALKSNSDPQYSTTVDFGTVCAKTQEIIDVMSQVMLQEGRGLTRDEVLKVYNETANAGLTVPCPVCYVFSRWMGVPGLLNQMSQYQKRFVKTNEDGSINMEATKVAANTYIKEALAKFGSKDKIDDAKTSTVNKMKTQEKNRSAALAIMNSETATAEEKAAAKVKHDAAIAKLDELTKDLGEVEAYNWVTQALCLQKQKGKTKYNVLDSNGDYVIDPSFELTPDDVLFDLRRTGEFAKFTKNWSYRNTRGAGMGKAIMPYSGMSVGDVIFGTDRKTEIQNPFLTQVPAKAADGIKNAIDRARKQNLIGGQRLQSTSDFRPEWGLDYMMAFLELQAVGSKVQMYTKVAEAVDLLASMGGDINLSIMGKGQGWHVDEKTGEKVLDFSDVTGMNYETARELKDKYDNVQMILVGMNDDHIRLAMASKDIDFIIPWHSSGNSKSTLASLVSSASIGKEQLETSSDYTDTQTDKEREDQTEEQKALWKLRMKIIQGKKISAEERDTIYHDPYLRPLYDRFNTKGVDPDCYGVKLAKDQAKQIFPYEYWDKTLTKDQADINGKRFVEYCAHFGIVPRFSGTVKSAEEGKFFTTEEVGSGKPLAYDSEGRVIRFEQNNFAGAIRDENGNITGYGDADTGYWKLLIDRPMYDNAKNYRDQQVVDVTKAKIGSIENGKLTGSDIPLATSAMYGPEYTEQEKTAVDNALAAIDDAARINGGQYSVFGGDMTTADMEQQLGSEKEFNIDDEILNMISDMDAAEVLDFLELQDLNDQNKTEETGTTEAMKPEEVQAVRQIVLSDDLYQEALDNDDLELAQKMVDQKAKEAGYTVLGTHRTNGEFTVFEKSERSGERGKTLGDAFYVAKGEGTEYDSDAYGKNRMRVYINPGNTLNLAKDGLSEAEARQVYDKYFAPFNPNAWEGHVDHVVSQMQSSYHLIDYIKEAAEKNGVTTDIIFKDLGYNSIKDGPQYAVFDSEQIKLADPVTYDNNGDAIPLSERFNNQNEDIRYSSGGDMTLADIDQDLINSGVLTEEELAAYSNLPGQPLPEEGGNRQRQFGYQTAQTSDALHQEVKDYLYTHSSYTPDTNQAQIDRAMDWVQSRATANDPDGYNAAVNEVTSDSFDYRSADGQARMLTVMGMAVLKGDLSTELRLADAYNKQGTDLGRQLQARKIFRMMTPIGRQATIQKMADQINEQYAKDGKDTRIGLSQWTLMAAAEAQTEEEFQRVQHAAAQELAEQMPPNWKDRLRGWRMLAMLGNPRTHIRNYIGNAMFVPAVGLKNKLGAIGEMAFTKGERTKTLAPFLSKEARAFARDDALLMKDILTGEAKYNEDNAVQREQKPFKGLLQAAIDFNGDMLEKEDWKFLKGHYIRALGSWMMANKYTAEELTNNPRLLESGREYAVQEAQKATYRDFSQLASTLNQVSRKGGVAGFLVDATLPFKKTPANILKRGMEYSVGGLMRSLTTDLYHLKQYNDYMDKLANGAKNAVLPEKAISPNQFIDRLCSGLAGTAIMAVGAILGHSGLVTCGLDDDDDKNEKEKGNQKYSFKFSIGGRDYTFTIDWAAPMSMPFFVGAAIQEQLANQKGFDIQQLIDAFGNITEPVFNLSMLDGVNTLFKTSQYDDTNTITQIGAKIASNYATSYVPSLMGAIARTVDEKQRKAFVKQGEGTGVLGTLRYAREQVENKIPGLSQTNIPVRDVFGNEKTSALAERILENFILPGYINEYSNDPILVEMDRLYNANVTDSEDMVPKDPAKSITYKKKKYVLSAEEWDQYKAVRGQTAYGMLTELVNSEAYKDADEAAQVQMMKKCWEYADKAGQQAVIPDYELDKEDVSSIVKSGKIANYNADLMQSLENGDQETYDTMVEALHEQGVEDGDIKTKIATKYRDQYKEAYRKGNNERMAEIENILNMTGYAFGLEKWERAVDEK